MVKKLIENLLAVSLISYAGWAAAFTPQAGTWIISGEMSGEPGRGFAMDVQGDTLVVQVFAYEKNGHPTFYTASGAVKENIFTGKLGRYSGGRYLGGPQQSGREDSTPGNVTIRFTSGIAGTIQLPGESEVAIQRFEFASQKLPAELLGRWVIDTTVDQNHAEVLDLVRVESATPGGTGFVAERTTGEIFGCEFREVNDGPYNLYCGERTAAGMRVIAKIRLAGIEGEGVVISPDTGKGPGYMYMRKLRDQNGKSLGIMH
ncbi:hypothetical protein [Comamonas sp.]|uniref:hypothetical protein n=1 Tax=Comamonas sp. TaxID=34028 RepID=UPI00258CF607|nr:hypothetical protein [Comamonas sp.]